MSAAPLRQAVAAGDDAQAAHLLRQTQGSGPLLGATFDELAARGLPQAAVALAQREAGGDDLREAEATSEGGSYLHAAAAAGAGAQVLAALVAAGCALDGRDGEGKCTALHAAARAGHLATCRALLELGADPLARNCAGRTAAAHGGMGDELKALLAEAEAAAKERRAEQMRGAWDAKMRATQTESALRTGCV